MTSPPELLYGDVNCDGRVDMNDAETLSRWLEVPETVDISEQGMANADVYCPGSGLTAEDAETIASFCKGLIPSLPVIPDPSIRRGDINEDGKINPVDASLILVKFADLSGTDTGSPSDATIRKYDINEDGRITAVDASLLLAYCADLAEDPDIQLLDFLAAHK